MGSENRDGRRGNDLLLSDGATYVMLTNILGTWIDLAVASNDIRHR